MKKYALIGFPLGHSFSAKYFAEFFAAENLSDYSYENFPLENIKKIEDMLTQNPELQGFNVTIPYKQEVMAYLSSMSEEAAAIGAVNCVKKLEDGSLKGYNTDAYGFEGALLDLIQDNRPSALILGTGGASKAVKYTLTKLGIKFLTVSRTANEENIGYNQIDKELLEQHPLVINCSPLGTYPNIEQAPNLPYEFMSDKNFLFDLVYNPPMTKFMSLGKASGAKVSNGHRMLILQAERSWEIWNN